MSTHTVETIVPGYHVYQVVWEVAVGQVLPCQRKRGNVHDAIVDRGACFTSLLAAIMLEEGTGDDQVSVAMPEST